MRFLYNLWILFTYKIHTYVLWVFLTVSKIVIHIPIMFFFLALGSAGSIFTATILLSVRTFSTTRFTCIIGICTTYTFTIGANWHQRSTNTRIRFSINGWLTLDFEKLICIMDLLQHLLHKSGKFNLQYQKRKYILPHTLQQHPQV